MAQWLVGRLTGGVVPLGDRASVAGEYALADNRGGCLLAFAFTGHPMEP